MLSSFYLDILALLKQEMTDLGFSEDNFGLDDRNMADPYFTVTESGFSAKMPQFKKESQETRPIEYTEHFTIPSSTNEGSFMLEYVPHGIVGIQLVTQPGTPSAVVTDLKPNQYELSGKKIDLAVLYPKDSLLQVTYTYLGAEHSDRFEQQFRLRVYDDDTTKLEEYASLALTAIWSSWNELAKNEYVFATGRLRTTFKLSEMSFTGQSIYDDEESTYSGLDFTIKGMISLTKVQPDGFHLIETVDLGEEAINIGKDGGIEVERAH